MDRIYFI